MTGKDDDTTGSAWKTEAILPVEAERPVEGASTPDGLVPLNLPDFDDGEDLATEALDTASRGTELPSRYEVRESLGREDTGDLFRVYDRELEREVILKLLREDTPLHAIAQFRDDARTVAKISHPGAVTVYDMGTLDDGRHFVTRAALEGRPLGRWAREVDVRRLIRWMMWATDTLAAAQRVGLIHRRLEPGSIVVGRVVKVRGFGVGVAEPSVFMAPELVRGDPSDASADVFSLGAIALDLLGDRCPKAVRTILKRATHEEAKQRHASAEALLADLEDWLDG